MASIRLVDINVGKDSLRSSLVLEIPLINQSITRLNHHDPSAFFTVHIKCNFPLLPCLNYYFFNNLMDNVKGLYFSEKKPEANWMFVFKREQASQVFSLCLNAIFFIGFVYMQRFLPKTEVFIWSLRLRKTYFTYT